MRARATARCMKSMDPTCSSARNGPKRERLAAGRARCVPISAIAGTPCTRSYSAEPANRLSEAARLSRAMGVDACE
jgi:hypothetical protein